MNRRDFLRLAGVSAAGATGTILVSSTAAQSLLAEGKAIISEQDVKQGKIITQADMIEEQVNIAQFGDNLAKLVLASGSITIDRTNSPDVFQVWGNVRVPYEDSNAFTQHSKYKLVHGGGRDRVTMSRR